MCVRSTVSARQADAVGASGRLAMGRQSHSSDAARLRFGSFVQRAAKGLDNMVLGCVVEVRVHGEG